MSERISENDTISFKNNGYMMQGRITSITAHRGKNAYPTIQSSISESDIEKCEFRVHITTGPFAGNSVAITGNKSIKKVTAAQAYRPYISKIPGFLKPRS